MSDPFGTPVIDPVWDNLTARWDEARDYTRHPVKWIKDKTGEEVWSAQSEILDSVRENRYTAVHSAHETGKTFLASRAITWWIDSHPLGEAFVVSTAPSAAQVSTIMWREVTKAHSKAGLDGRINRAGYPQWLIGGQIVGYGRKPGDHEESAFQGLHARYVLVVIDEAGGVPQQLYNAIDSIVANEHSRVLAIGNPDDPGSHFATICKADSIWNVIHLDALRSPNMSKERVIGRKSAGHGYANPRYPLTHALMEAEAIPYSTEPVSARLAELLVDPLWIEERIQQWAGLGTTAHLDYAPDELRNLIRSRCEASALFQAKVRGVFPSSTATGVIPLGWVEYAINRWHDYCDEHRREDGSIDYSHVPNPSRNVVGVDVAYGGQDETAIAIRYGDMIAELHRFRHADTIETADEASRWLHETGSLAVVDVIGIGAGVFDTLRRYRRNNMIQATAIAFNASASTARLDAIGQFKFRNDRAAAWWRLRQLLDPSRNSRLMLPDDERMKVELTAPKYKILAGGIIQVESKDDIRKRLGRSTDSADAVIQAFWPGASDNVPTEAIPYGRDDARRSGDGVVYYNNGSGHVSQEDLMAIAGSLDATVGGSVGADRIYSPASAAPDFGDWDI